MSERFLDFPMPGSFMHKLHLGVVSLASSHGAREKSDIYFNDNVKEN